MFSIINKGPNRIDIDLSGKLDAEEMTLALDDLIHKSQSIESGRMLYRIHDFKFPTLGAIGVELSRMPKLFELIKKFDRAAVLVDKPWLKKASEIEGKLIPGLEIKAFDHENTVLAEAWLKT